MKRLIQKDFLDQEISTTQQITSGTAQNYVIEGFEQQKKKLNEIKTKIDRYFLNPALVGKYGEITSYLRPTTELRRRLMNDYNGQLVTRAWIKFIEIALYYELFDHFHKNALPVKVFMNAELPGAAVAAFNHLYKTMMVDMKYDWVGSSIVIGQDIDNRINALGDKYGIWEKNKNKWLMTVDISGKKDKTLNTKPGNKDYINDGDATIIDNLLDYESRIGGTIDIATHDAGIDVSAPIKEGKQTGFNDQEEQNMKIHFGCAVASFITLKIGGAFVAKQYTFFEPFTVTAMMLYSDMFEKFYICKPISSGQSNSEIYLVGKGFKGFKYRELFLNRLKNWNIMPFIEKDDLPKDSNQKILDFCKVVTKQQSDYIKENIFYYENYKMKPWLVKKGTRWAQIEYADNWLKKYKINPINESDYLPSIKKRNEWE